MFSTYISAVRYGTSGARARGVANVCIFAQQEARQYNVTGLYFEMLPRRGLLWPDSDIMLQPLLYRSSISDGEVEHIHNSYFLLVVSRPHSLPPIQ